MKNKPYFLNTALGIILGLALLVCVILRTFAPIVILPKLDIPNMVLLSLGALLLEHYLSPESKRCYGCVALFGALSFGLLPLAAGFVGILDAVKLGVVGGIVFTVTTLLFTSARERLASGPVAKAAPVLSAFGLYLAAQCFGGMIL